MNTKRIIVEYAVKNLFGILVYVMNVIDIIKELEERMTNDFAKGYFVGTFVTMLVWLIILC